MGNLLNPSCFPEEPKTPQKLYSHLSLPSHLKSHNHYKIKKTYNHPESLRKVLFLFSPHEISEDDNNDNLSIKVSSYRLHLFYYMEKKKEEDHHHHHQEQQSSKNKETKIEHQKEQEQEQKQQISQASSSNMANLATSSDHHQLELAGSNMNLSSFFDTSSLPFPYSYFEDHSSNNPNSFLDLLRQDHHQFASSSNSSTFSFDTFPLPNNNNNSNPFFTDLPLPQAESSEVVNTAPTSPNSTSVSSSSNEAANDNNSGKEVLEKNQEEENQQEQKGTKPQ